MLTSPQTYPESVRRKGLDADKSYLTETVGETVTLDECEIDIGLGYCHLFRYLQLVMVARRQKMQRRLKFVCKIRYVGP